MKLQLRWLMAVMACLFSFSGGPIVRGVDFYATNQVDNNIYGVDINGTVTLIGPSGNSANSLFDIATDPVSQSVYYLEGQKTGSYSPLLYSATIGAGGATQSPIGGAFSANQLVEGGLAFSSFQGTNTLYASGNVGTYPNFSQYRPTLYSINTSTGIATVVSTNFLATQGYDVQSIFSAPDGRLWGLNQEGTQADLFRFATNGTVDQIVVLTGFEQTGIGGVTVKNGVTYYLISPQGFGHSSFGTFGWDSVNKTYTGTFNQMTNTIIGGMSGLALAPAAVPEPSTYALVAIAAGFMAAVARRRKARKS